MSPKYWTIACVSSTVMFVRTCKCVTMVAVMRGEYCRTAEWQRMQLFLYASSGSPANQDSSPFYYPPHSSTPTEIRFMNSIAHPSTSAAANRLSSRPDFYKLLGRFLHRWAELDHLPALLRRNRGGIVPEFARYVELNYLCHKSAGSSPLESLPRGVRVATGLPHCMGAGSLRCALR